MLKVALYFLFILFPLYYHSTYSISISYTKSKLQTANRIPTAFPAKSPAVYELYWSPSQLRARSHPSLLKAQKFLMSMWHSSSPATKLCVQHPLTYADRLRVRLPGDSGFALGAHVDGGSLERWEDPQYSAVYSKIFRGEWEGYDAYDARHRVTATMDLYNGAGSCAMFRMWQGWVCCTAPILTSVAITHAN